MYTLSVRRNFIARHYLVGGDWGPENCPNSHHYVLELRLFGQDLNQHGYLVDIVEIEGHMNALVSAYREKMLNDLPDFTNLNPSLENFARVLAVDLNRRITAKNLNTLEVVLWENDSAWASFSVARPSG